MMRAIFELSHFECIYVYYMQNSEWMSHGVYLWFTSTKGHLRANTQTDGLYARTLRKKAGSCIFHLNSIFPKIYMFFTTPLIFFCSEAKFGFRISMRKQLAMVKLPLTLW